MDILQKIINGIKQYGISSLITAIVTYFTVKKATKQYYKKTRKEVAFCILDLGIRSMFNINYSSPLPDTAKAIFVENGKSSLLMLPERFKETKCTKRGIRDLRTTIATVGKFETEISACRPKKWGVLGLAYQLELPVMFNFREGRLFVYTGGVIKEETVEKTDECYCYQGHELSKRKGNSRSIMVAVPIIRDYAGSKKLGGVTFDFAPNENTIYQEVSVDDPEDEKQRKIDQNKRVFQSAMSTAKYLKIAYFQPKEKQ